jgi:hypothetical protein
MAAPKLLDIVPGEGSRSAFTAIITGVINVIILVASLFGFHLPTEVWLGINTVAGTAFALFFADKVDRGNEATAAVAANQPNEQPVVVVTTSDPKAMVASSGVDVVR